MSNSEFPTNDELYSSLNDEEDDGDSTTDEKDDGDDGFDGLLNEYNKIKPLKKNQKIVSKFFIKI